MTLADGSVLNLYVPPALIADSAHGTNSSQPLGCIDCHGEDIFPHSGQSPASARAYRIEVAPGRYYLLGWVQGGELALIAHASQIRCIRAPCPPDELIAVEVAAGEARTGIDLSGGYIEVPADTPAGPPNNVAALYRRLGKAIRTGSAVEPDFDHAVKRHRLIDRIASGG